MTCGGGAAKVASARLEICRSCEFCANDTCQIVDAKHPGRANVVNGSQRPELYCPVGKWTCEPHPCGICGRMTKEIWTCKPCQNKRRLDPKYQPRKGAEKPEKDFVVPTIAEPIPAPKWTQNAMTAAWVYLAAGAKTDELRYSIRSVATNMIDLANIVVCGDRPSWYHGDFIDSPRSGGGTYAKWFDSIKKMQRLIESPDVTDTFLWMYDDSFLLLPTTGLEIARPRAVSPIARNDIKRRNLWRKVRGMTRRALHAAGRPAWDYSTHYPVVYEKDKLAETIKRFSCLVKPYCIETLYLNHHFDEPELRSLAGFQYRKVVSRGWKVRANTHLINVGQFNRAAQVKIRPRFQNIAECEIEPTDELAFDPLDADECCNAGGCCN